MITLFTSEERQDIRGALLHAAATDHRITGGAITGSAAANGEDRWSDIDLAFGVRNASDMPNVVSDWTRLMYERFFALHHLDVVSGPWIYRVFVLPNSLQVDLAFVPAEDFRPLAPSFQLVFGNAAESRHRPQRGAAEVIGYGWLYALHARGSIARRKLWQAEYMISGLRDTVLALACLRHNVPAGEGRGIHLLPDTVVAPLEGALVRHLSTDELVRAFAVAIHGLLTEIRFVDDGLARRLQELLTDLTKSVADSN
jgi:hypothetical protein